MSRSALCMAFAMEHPDSVSASSAIRRDRWHLSDAHELRPSASVSATPSLRTFVERDRYRRAKLIWAAADSARQEGRIGEYNELVERWRRVLQRAHVESRG